MHSCDRNKRQNKSLMTLFSHRQENTFFITQIHINQQDLTKLPSLKLMDHILQS